jgi:hypothetical protein
VTGASDLSAGQVQLGLDDMRPSWDLYRRMLDSPDVSPARRTATSWALDELEQCMGPDWLGRYFDACGHVPAEVNLGSAHRSALGNLLDFALRLAVLDRVPGAGKIQRDMRRDLRDERRRHCALQLEVGALGACAGYTPAFEDPFEAGAPPSDVVLRGGGITLRVETFAILRDQRAQEVDAFWHRVTRAIMNLEMRHGTPIAGTIGDPLDEEGSAELLRALTEAAEHALHEGHARQVSMHGTDLLVQPPGGTDHCLESSIYESDCWPRITSKLRGKAEQAKASGCNWIRLDLLDGTWGFTPWARASLRGKIDEMERQLQPALAPYPGISGVVLSNGPSVAQGEFIGESAHTPQGSYALRRVLPAVRVRETMIVALSEKARAQARAWVDIYGPEEHWLDWALQCQGLPAWDAVRI